MIRPYDGIDTAAKITTATARALRQEGISFVARYLVPESYSKALTKAEAGILRDAGLAILPVWETYAKRIREGAKAGGEDGKTARKLAEGLDMPAGTVIYFAADYDAPAADYDAIEAYLDAASLNSGLYRIGLYGHEKLVDAMYHRGYRNFWQCVAWSNAFSDNAGAIQYEWQGGDNAKALAEKVGVGVDLDAAATLDGMWLPEAKSTEAEDAHKWCVSVGISDDSMRDNSQTELMFYRYHFLTAPDDYKTASGLLTD